MGFFLVPYLYVTPPLRLTQQLPVLIPDLHRPACLSVHSHAMRKPEAVLYLLDILPTTIVIYIHLTHGQKGSFSFFSTYAALGSFWSKSQK